MKSKDLIAKAETTIAAPVNMVWDAFVNPEKIKKYMFGATVMSDWKEGSKIIWKGEWKGKPYEDHGTILKLSPLKKIQYSHFSPLSGKEDIPENYHVVTIDLEERGKQTFVSLTQNRNATEKELEESQKNWTMMLESLKTLVEESNKTVAL